MARSEVVSYWRKGLRQQNFGDYLSEVLHRAFCVNLSSPSRKARLTGDYGVVHLIGSVISDYHIRAGLEHIGAADPQTIVFWGCGVRGEDKLDPELAEHAVFLGVRGPLTRDVLALPDSTVLGDPALLLPAIYGARKRPELADKVLCAPHFLETRPDEDLCASTNADVVLRPNIAPDFGAACEFIDTLTSARFVLCGALHAAIVCCAYGTRFCYFDSGYIDVPFKWRDFAASVGIGDRFAKTLAEGEAIYRETIAGKVRLPDLEAILSCAPYKAPRALRLQVRALQAATTKKQQLAPRP